ncbi:MAG: hypothetical protein JXR94_10090 [Candidatus Hydrogenedentes bacterium]|nr:hypothetical protein [Candidatus Hydrogenedentota bacterium]
MVNAIAFENAAEVAAQPAVRALSGFPAGRLSASFAEVLAGELRPAGDIRFSAHAMQRLTERGVTLTEADQARLGRALDEAAAKGAKESLVLMDRLAFVVSVPNRTVITAVPQNDLEDAVFTNIDSAVVVSARTPLPRVSFSRLRNGLDPVVGSPGAAD